MKNQKRKTTEQLVQDILLEHPEWTGPQVYDRYVILVDPNLKVTKNAVEKHVKKFKDNKAVVDEKGLDQRWSLDKTPELPADAIAAIFSVLKDKPNLGISIRQAIWISKLHTTVSKLIGKRPSDLWFVSFVYTQAELHSDLTGKQYFDTTVFDNSLLKGNKYFIEFGKNAAASYPIETILESELANIRG